MIESLQKITKDNIICTVKGNLLSIKTKKLKLPAANMTCFLGIVEKGIVFSVFRKTNLKQEVFQDTMLFEEIIKFNVKETTLTKQKILEIYGKNNTSFKFSFNNNEEVNKFIECLNN